MKKIRLKLNNGKLIPAVITNEELIYGATAVAVGVKNNYGIVGEEGLVENLYAIHPFTNEKMPVIALNNEVLTQSALMLVPAHVQEHFDLAEEYNLPFKQVVAPYYKGVGDEEVNPDAETQFRRSVIVVIKNKKDNTYLCVDAQKRVCKSFVMGGIEGDETPEEAAVREVAEETGYTDVKITRTSMFVLHNHFYAAYKGVNRYAHLYVVFGELNSDAREVPSEEELKKQVALWISREDLKYFLSVNLNIFVNNYILEKDCAFEGDGILVNSDILNGRLRSEVKKG